jgi:hypothetical protein
MTDETKWRRLSYGIGATYIAGAAGIMSFTEQWTYDWVYGQWIFVVLFLALCWVAVLFAEIGIRSGLSSVAAHYRGNLSHFSVQTIRLYWDGPEDIEFDISSVGPLTFTWENALGETITVDGTVGALRNRIANSGLPQQEMDSLVEDIMRVAAQIRNGERPQPLHARPKSAEPHVRIPSYWDYTLGTGVWMLLFAALCSVCYHADRRRPTKGIEHIGAA